MTKKYVIETQNLTKNYNGLVAVDHVDLQVKNGEIFGYLGPNGAGKTTTIKMLLGLRKPTAGSILINGKSFSSHSVELRDTIGYLPERLAFYDYLTPVETLNFFCELKGADKSIVRTLLREIGLEKAADRKVGKFSSGMVQLLGIAQAMIGNPPIYVFDEPMSGLDPEWVKVVREKIKHLNKQGATVLFSSHILSEVQHICDRVAILDKGKLVAQDSPSNLSKNLRMKPRLEVTIPGLNGRVPEAITAIPGVYASKAQGSTLLVTSEPEARTKVITTLVQEGLVVQNFKTIEPALEDVFMKLTSRGDIR